MERAGSAAFARGSERKLALDAARAGVSTEALGWLHALTGPGTTAGAGGAAQVRVVKLNWHRIVLVCHVLLLQCSAFVVCGSPSEAATGRAAGALDSSCCTRCFLVWPTASSPQ